VLVRFRFTGGQGTKRRPAVILTGDHYHNSRADAVMLALSTRRGDHYFGDCEIVDWQGAGLPQPTKAKGVIQTIEQRTVESRLGTLSANDFTRVKQSVRDILGL